MTKLRFALAGLLAAARLARQPTGAEVEPAGPTEL